jgi:hypothetical protein
MVLCVFDATLPSVAVSAAGLNESGLSSSLSQIDEVRPADGSVVASASMANASWSRANASTDGAFDMAYQAHVAILSSGPAPTQVGSVDVRTDYILPAYASSAATNLTSVTARLQVSNWTWQAPGDQLDILVPLWPTFASAEHLSVANSATPTVTSIANSSGSLRESFQFGLVANATTPLGVTVPISVAPAMTVHPGAASVALKIGTAAGGFRSLTYVAQIGVHLPASVAGIPLYEFALVGAAAGVVSILVAVGTRAVRRRPSDLTYVEEEP